MDHPELTDLVVTLVQMVSKVQMDLQEKKAYWDKEVTEEILVQRDWLVLRDFPAPQVQSELLESPGDKETPDPEDQWGRRVRLGRED